MKTKTRIDINELAKIYCKSRSIRVSSLTSPSRKYKLPMYRHGFVALCKSQGFDEYEIMDFLKRERTCYYNSIERHKDLTTNNWYRRVVLNHKPNTWLMIEN